MRNDELSNQSMAFAVLIIDLIKELKSKHESVISNQIGRSGTSIGANIREAQYAHGKADFIAKLQISLKEANETGYWLELLFKTGYLTDAQYKSLDSACTSIRCDASCSGAYLDWICVLKNERHNRVAQELLNALRAECREQGVGLLVALMASNDEAQSFYKHVEGASIHDTGIWIEIG